MLENCTICNKQAGVGRDEGKDTCPLLMASYILAGLAMMLNIRLSYSSAPYALIRFRLPENLFSVFVRRMASALELWCLPSMLLGNIMDLSVKSAMKLSGDLGDNAGNSKFIKFWVITIPSIICQWLNFLTYVILLVVYLIGGDQGRLTTFYFVIAISGFVFGINMTLVYSADYNYTPVYIAGENSFPALTSFIHYLTTLMFGNRRKWNSDYLIVCVDIVVAIIISFAAAVVWSVAYGHYAGTYPETIPSASEDLSGKLQHIFANAFGGEFKSEAISPALMIVVGMGLVYAIYPGIAPGMIVPFYLIDKIEMVLLIATIFPPVLIALFNKGEFGAKDKSPKSEYPFNGWTQKGAWYWHLIDLLIVTKITLAAIFIYCLHYRDSNLSRSIVNQPKMSTALSIVFYMCHEILLAVGFSGIIGNGGGDLILIPQYIGALFMIFLAFYSEGYIIEYKSHDPAHWPTTGMTKWNAFCYWCKRASKITNHNLRSLFTTDLRGLSFY
uniref:Theileria-specific sub-telomeric protein, putative n=1 Tax=Theileria annulata TaxID=5874 RepID=A0A3B0MH84_THEAN